MQSPSNIDQIRERIADQFLLAAMLSSIPAACISSYRILLMGWRPIFVAAIMNAVVMILCYVTRSWTTYKQRMYILIFYVFIMGSITISDLGLFGIGLLILLFSCLIYTVMFGLRSGVFLTFTSALVITFYGVGVHYKWITFHFDFNALNSSSLNWFIYGFFYLGFATITVVILGLTHKYFEQINSKLTESDKRFNLALESVNEAIWDYNFIDNKVFISDKIFELLGYEKGEFSSEFSNWRKLIHPDDVEFVDKSIKECFSCLTPSLNIEFRILNSSGEWHWVQSQGKIVEYEPSGKPIRALGTHTDITTRKNIEKSLLVSQERYRHLFENANDAILLLENEKIIDCNAKAQEFYKVAYNDLVGKTPYFFSPKNQPDGTDSKTRVKNLLTSISKTGSKKFEWEHIDNEGNKTQTLVSLSLLSKENDPIFIAIVHDITEHYLFEQKKLNAIVETEEKERAQLAGDLHDEVGPLLSSLNMYLSLINREETENKKEILVKMESILKDSILSVREISNNLSPHVLVNYGLISAVYAFLESKRGLIKINFEESLDNKRLPANIEAICYRIIKELLNNTLKYANAKSAYIGIHLNKNLFSLIYKDDGVGFNLKEVMYKQHSGIGLLNITNRINTLKADYNIFSEQGKGFKFEMQLRID